VKEILFINVAKLKLAVSQERIFPVILVVRQITVSQIILVVVTSKMNTQKCFQAGF